MLLCTVIKAPDLPYLKQLHDPSDEVHAYLYMNNMQASVLGVLLQLEFVYEHVCLDEGDKGSPASMCCLSALLLSIAVNSLVSVPALRACVASKAVRISRTM